MSRGCAGKSLAENLKDCPDLTDGQKVIVPLETPIKESGHIQILYGNLAPQVWGLSSRSGLCMPLPRH